MEPERPATIEIKNIEKFFLNTLLIVTMTGLFIILVSNLLIFPEDTLSIWITVAILSACTLSYLLRLKYPTAAVLVITTVALAAMSYQRLTVPNTSTTLSVVLIVGFIYSVMLKGRIMWIMHGIAFTLINTIFIIHVDDAITAAITYSTLYFILTFATGVLKTNYDKINQYLRDRNMELHEKGVEIAAQNAELLKIQHNLSELNKDLDKIVNERTSKIQIQNEILIKYSYTNAHHLRGPVARMLGLASLYKLQPDPDPEFFINTMLDQVNEIDSVIQQINIELDSSSFDIRKEK